MLFGKYFKGWFLIFSMNQNSNNIKQKLIAYFDSLLSSGEIKIESLTDSEAYGHLAGTPLEVWVKSKLEKEWQIFFPNEFLMEVFDNLKEERKILSFLDSTWWGKLLFTPKQLKDYNSGKQVRRWQQEGADLVLFYGESIIKEPEKVILLNVKSHESTRNSRPPNIMSAQRLLQFFDFLLSKNRGEEILNSMELWFIGVTYNAEEGGKIERIYVKDLLKLDAMSIPQINFDAAIQIQWHVEDMIEVNQKKQDFVLTLAKEFIRRWEHHIKTKQIKYKKLTDKLIKMLS